MTREARTTVGSGVVVRGVCVLEAAGSREARPRRRRRWRAFKEWLVVVVALPPSRGDADGNAGRVGRRDEAERGRSQRPAGRQPAGGARCGGGSSGRRHQWPWRTLRWTRRAKRRWQRLGRSDRAAASQRKQQRRMRFLELVLGVQVLVRASAVMAGLEAAGGSGVSAAMAGLACKRWPPVVAPCGCLRVAQLTACFTS